MDSEVTGKLLKATQDFKSELPVIVELGNPAMEPRHWERLFEVQKRRGYGLPTKSTRGMTRLLSFI